MDDQTLARSYCQHCGDWGGWFEPDEGTWVGCPCSKEAIAQRDAARARAGIYIIAHGPPPAFGCRLPVVGRPLSAAGLPV